MVSLWIHNKTGENYTAHKIGTNCTNNADGQDTVRYTKKDDQEGKEFYRELKEFQEKFTIYSFANMVIANKQGFTFDKTYTCMCCRD